MNGSAAIKNLKTGQRLFRPDGYQFHIGKAAGPGNPEADGIIEALTGRVGTDTKESEPERDSAPNMP